MKTLFFDSFYYSARTIETSDGGPVLISGFGSEQFEKESDALSKSNFINALLVHDEIVLKGKNLLMLIEYFGFHDTIQILKSGAIKLIEEDSFRPQVMAFSRNDVRLEFIESITEKDFLKFLELRLNQFYPQSKSNFFHILAWAYKLKSPPLKEADHALLKEIHHDLENQKIRELYNLKTESPYKIHPSDAHSLVRLITLNTGVCYSAELKCPNLMMDAEVKNLLNAKLSPAIMKMQRDTIGTFNEVLNLKRLPDIADLYFNNILNIHDILEIRESFGGRKYRDWLFDVNYNFEEIVYQLCTNPKVKFKNLRFVLTTLAGLPPEIGIVTGAAAGFVDSYILDRILNGWHPSLFLDKKLKETIDKAVKAQNKKVEEELRLKYNN